LTMSRKKLTRLRVLILSNCWIMANLASRQCSNSDFDEAMTLGIRYNRMEDWANAVPCLERAHRLKRDNTIAMIYLGETYLKSGRVKDSIKVLLAPALDRTFLFFLTGDVGAGVASKT
jgi:hypothetical protein